MADRNQLRLADRQDIAEDDPFAELTRIMGFDPRQPARRQTIPQPQAADALSNDDFDIDLEKEMMAGFGLDDDAVKGAAAMEAPATNAEPAPAPELEDEVAASLDQDFQLEQGRFDDSPELDIAAMAETVGEPPLDVAPEPAFEEPVFEDHAFDAVFARSLDDELTADAAAELTATEGASEPLQETASGNTADETAFDGAFVEAPEGAPDAAADTPLAEATSEPLRETAPEPVFEAVSLEDELHSGDELQARADLPEEADLPWESDLPEEETRADDFRAVEAQDDGMRAKATSIDDFDDHFDRAMADVDMDFGARPDLRIVTEDVDADDQDDAAAATAGQLLDEEFESGLRDVFGDEPAGETVAQAEETPAEQRETSLEDELNALLGNMGARTWKTGGAAAGWRPTPAVVEPAPARPDAADEQPIVDHLGITRSDIADSRRQETPLPARDSGFDDRLAEELNVGDFAVDSAAGPVGTIDFDHDAFDAALAAGIDLHHEEGAQETEEEDRIDPFEGFTSSSMPAQFWNGVTPVAQSQAAPVYSDARIDDEIEPMPKAYDEVPELETVEVPERVVALADDLDIPELAFEVDQPASTAYDDIEAEFTSLLNEMNEVNAAEAAAAARVGSHDGQVYGANFGRDGQQDQGGRLHPVETPAAASYGHGNDGFGGFSAADLPGSRPVAAAEPFASDELDYDPEFDEAIPALTETEAARQPRGRGLLVAAVVGAVAIAGGIGAFALSLGGSGGTDAPVIVKADNAPIKVKPENPGGTVVPNQDNKVYDAVNGIQPAAPEQKKLVTNTEEPVDVTAEKPAAVPAEETAAVPAGKPEAVAANEPQSRIVDLLANDAGDEAAAPAAQEAAAPAPKSEDRVEQTAQDDANTTNPAVAAVAPRKVRTMIVKADGSLVPRDEAAPVASQIAATEPADPAPQHVMNPSAKADTRDQTGALPSAAAATGSSPQTNGGQAAAEPAATAAAAPEAAASKTRTQSASTPAVVPVAPSRPAEQPVDIVGEVKPDRVASIDPSTPTASTGSWSMQIASQPSVESAKTTYQDLARRYGSVLEGHPVNIVKADIAGKGTFYRVRVPAQSRNDAINLCTSYKAAGGNCFVSK